MMDYSSWTRAALAKEVNRRKIVEGWMTTFMNKAALIKVLTFAQDMPEGKRVALPQAYVEELQMKREERAMKNKTARRRRDEKFGTSSLTQREILVSLVRRSGGLQFVERRTYPDGFESSTGAIGGQHARVFRDGSGTEYLFTQTESKVLAEQLGVHMPNSAKRYEKAPLASKTGHVTFKDLW